MFENSGVFAIRSLPSGKSRRYAQAPYTSCPLPVATREFSFDVRDFDVIVGGSRRGGSGAGPAARARLGVLEHRVDQVRMNLQHEVPQDAVVDFPLAIERR